MTLWAVNIQGPDDLIAMASFDDALNFCLTFNPIITQKFGPHRNENDPVMWAVPCQWPGDPLSHRMFVGNLGDYAWVNEARPPLLAENEKLREAIKPFLDVLENDVGQDEADADFFHPMNTHNRAERLRVGHFRALRAALGEPQ